MSLGGEMGYVRRQAQAMAWSSMLGMAGMFIFTICTGIFIQPAWNFEEAKAFGEEGSTEVGEHIFRTDHDFHIHCWSDMAC